MKSQRDKGGNAEATAIARWAEARTAAPRTSGISTAEQWQIVRASERQGVTVESLALEFGREASEVGTVLAQWTDTTPAAKRLLKARALALAERMIADADPGVALDVLERLAVVDPKQRGGMESGVTILVGAGSDVKIGILNQAPAVIDGDA